MRIGYFVNAFPSLSETFILNQIIGTIQRGHEVIIHADRPNPDPPKIHADVERYGLIERTRYREPVPFRRVVRLRRALAGIARWGWRHPSCVLDSLNYFRHGRQALNLSVLNSWLPENETAEGYDVIHCHFGPNGQRTVAMRLVGALRGPIITTFHGYDANLLPRIHGRKIYTQLFRHGDLFTVGSEFMRRRILSLEAPAERIVNMPMGVDVTRYLSLEDRRSDNGEFRLLTIARLVEVKGIEYVLRALALLKRKRPRLRYCIAGDGPLRTKLEALTTELGLAPMVEFLGAVSQEEALKLYEAAHGFVLPSVVTESGEEENQPVVLAEAQASGLPVIATAIGGIPESMCDGESGLLVPQRNAEALASAILWLTDHPESWSRMGRAGRKFVKKHFDLDGLNDQLVDLYRAVIAHAKL